MNPAIAIAIILMICLAQASCSIAHYYDVRTKDLKCNMDPTECD